MSQKRRLVALTALGIAIMAIYIYVNDPWEIYHNLSKADPLWVAVAVALNTASLGLAAMMWHLSLKAVGARIPFPESLKATMISIFGDMMIPTASVAGEAMRISYLHNKLGLGLDRATAGLAVHRTAYAVLLLIFSIIGASYLPPLLRGPGGLLVLGIIAWVFVFAALLLFLERLRGPIFKIIDFAYGRLRWPRDPEAAKAGIDRFIGEVKEGLRHASSSRGFVTLILVVGSLQWIVAGLMFYTVFLALGYGGMNPIELVLIFPIYGTLTLFPIGIPASMGIVETGLTVTYMSLGVERSVAVAATILTRGILVWYDLLVSGSVFIRNLQYVAAVGPSEG